MSEAAPAPIPPWFRAVVWDSLLGGLCLLLPLPILDDLAYSRMRRRMVERLLARWSLRLAPAELALLAGGPRSFSLGRFVGKAILYLFKEFFRKILYFLAIKDAADAFSLLFHQGYLLHAALSRGALGPAGVPDEGRVTLVATAVHGTLAVADTRPVGQLLRGVLRNSGRLLVATLRWVKRPLAGRAPVPEVAAESASRQPLGSPDAEQLLDRVLLVLWGEQDYLQRLDAELDRRLSPPATLADPVRAAAP